MRPSPIHPRLPAGPRPLRDPQPDVQLDIMRGMLEEQRTFRTEQLAELYRRVPAGPLGSADAEIRDRLAAGARRALNAVQAALWRMDEGAYGRCTGCAGPVEPERLEILPQAAMCLPCQRGAGAGR